MAESRGMSIIKSNDGSILFRASLFDAANAKITAGATDLRIWHFVPTTGAFETYDYNDNTFKAGAVTTATVAMTHRQAENSTYNTGVWSYRHTTLTAFVIGDKYVAEVSNASLPHPIQMEFQYGEGEGDAAVLRTGLAAAGSASTITLDGSAVATARYYQGCIISILAGTGAGQVRYITHYTAARVASVTPDWITNPDATSVYQIEPFAAQRMAVIRANIAAGGGANYITLDAGASATNQFYRGCDVMVVGGTGAGQCRKIKNYVGGTQVATVDRNWSTNPDNTSIFQVIGDAGRGRSDTGLAQAGAGQTITLATTASGTNNYYIGQTVRLCSGTGAGQAGVIISYDGGTKVATISRTWATNPDNTTAYEVVDSTDALGFSDVIWDEPMAVHVGAGSTGACLDALGSAIDARTNNANLNALLGVPDEAGLTAGTIMVGGTADAGSDATHIVDAARTEADTDYWHEGIVFMCSGPNAGQGRRITAFTPATDTITVSPAFTQPVAAGNVYMITKDISGDVSIAPADILAVADAVWDEDIIAAHGAASAAGLLLRCLGGAISTRANNATLNALLGVPDVALNNIAYTIFDEDIVTKHATANTAGFLLRCLGGAISNRVNNNTLNELLGVPDVATADIAWTIWDEDIVAAHGTAATAGLLLRVLGGAISIRANNATLNALLGVPDVATADIAWTIWDEDIVAGHGTADTAGLLLRALGAAISQRGNNPTLNALLGVPDVAANNIAETIWDEVLDAAHVVADSAAQRLKAIDDLTQAGGAGDLAANLAETNKIDASACTLPATHNSLADILMDIEALIAAAARAFVVSVNIESTSMHIECGLEQYGIMTTTPTQCACQILDEAGGIVKTIGVGDFGAIGPRGLFTYTWLSHTLLAGNTYQALITITDGVPIQTTKVFKMISV